MVRTRVCRGFVSLFTESFRSNCDIRRRARIELEHPQFGAASCGNRPEHPDRVRPTPVTP
jgi:hypothetical protein